MFRFCFLEQRLQIREKNKENYHIFCVMKGVFLDMESNPSNDIYRIYIKM